MSFHRGRTFLVLGLAGAGFLMVGCSSAGSSSAHASKPANPKSEVLVLGAHGDRGLTVQADRVARGILNQGSGGPAIVIVPTEE